MKTLRQVQWWPSRSRSCSPARAFKTSDDKADGWAMGIEEHVSGMPLVPSSHFKITEHHLRNHCRCCT